MICLFVYSGLVQGLQGAIQGHSLGAGLYRSLACLFQGFGVSSPRAGPWPRAWLVCRSLPVAGGVPGAGCCLLSLLVFVVCLVLLAEGPTRGGRGAALGLCLFVSSVVV